MDPRPYSETDELLHDLRAQVRQLEERVKGLEAALPPGLVPSSYLIVERLGWTVNVNHADRKWNVWGPGGQVLPGTGFNTPAEALAAARKVKS